MAPPRSPDQRKVDALAKLTAEQSDVWVASASSEGAAHLVPLSFAWDGEHVILATEPPAITTRNILASQRARLALGGTRDVVMIDAVLSTEVTASTAPEVAARYAAQADWDPRSTDGEFVYLLLRPERIQAWREANEITGRTIMRDGQWRV
jgi:hypothetical protein